MLMSRRAIAKFLARPHRDYSKWKALSDAALERKRRKLPIRPPIWTKLKKHQKVSFIIGARKRQFAYFNETGTGKTFLSIALMAYFKRTGETKCNLVLVPNKINKYEWRDEGFAKHAPNMKCVVLAGSTEHKWDLIADNPDADCFVETYGGFVRMVCDLKKVKRKRKGRSVDIDKLIPSKKKVKACMELFDGVYLDESTYVKNKSKLPWRICNQLSKSAAAFFILTATPFGRNLEDVWPQVFLVDRGETLGETLGLFRAAFFKEKDRFFGGKEYVIDKEGKRKVSKRLDNISIAYPADEADMPHLNRVSKHAVLSEDAEQLYERAKTALLSARGAYTESKNAFMRMRQISSGFVGFADDETGTKAKYVFPTNPKLDMLEALVTQFKPEDKFIIFHEFNYSAGVISDKLTELGIKHVLINGMRNDGDAARSAFAKDPKVQGLVLSNSAGGYGLNLQNAKHGIYFESPVGAILRKQTERRFYRQYSRHKTVFLWDLLVRGTVDETIIQFHEEGRSLWKAILNHGPGVLAKKQKRKRERLEASYADS